MNTTTNSQLLLVALDVARTASVSLDPTSANYLADGEVVVTREDGRTILVAAASPMPAKVRVVQRKGDKLVASPILDGSKLKSYKGAAYAAATEQVTYIGYNGASEAIDVINSNVYLTRVIRQDTQATFLNKEMMKFGTLKSSASASQSEISLGLASSLIANFAREPEKEIKFESVCDDAGAIIPTGTGTVNVSNGSKVITFLTDVADATGATVLLVNEFLRFGTAVTDPVYKIMSIDVPNEQITLDRPYEGVSDSAVANNTIERITVALGAAADWGIKMTGLARKFTAGTFKYSKVRFEVTLAEDFGTTVVTKSAAATEGVGMYEQVAELEWFVGSNAIERIGTPSPVITASVGTESGHGYGWIEIACDNVSHVGVAGPAVSKIEVKIACNGGAAGGTFGTSITDNTNGVADTLDAWASAHGGFAASGLA